MKKKESSKLLQKLELGSHFFRGRRVAKLMVKVDPLIKKALAKKVQASRTQPTRFWGIGHLVNVILCEYFQRPDLIFGDGPPGLPFDQRGQKKRA